MMDGMARPDKVQRYTIGWTREPVPCIHLWGDTGRCMKGNESPQVSGNAHNSRHYIRSAQLILTKAVSTLPAWNRYFEGVVPRKTRLSASGDPTKTVCLCQRV